MFGQFEKKRQRFEGYVGGQVAHSSFWRFGNFRNGRFPDDSEGKSEVNSFLNVSVKAGGIYKITGRHFIAANAAYLDRPPASNISFTHTRCNGPGPAERIGFYSGDIDTSRFGSRAVRPCTIPRS